jgi:cellulose biosynthesis protein BcsQ
MTTADIVLAASAREWPDRLHRYLLDHGGGRVVDRLMGADRTGEISFDVLVIDDICSFLTPRLIGMVKNRGVDVVGVYDPEDGPDAKRRLLECGIPDVIESRASPAEFLEKINQTRDHRVKSEPPSASPRRRALSVGVTGASEGVGMTEVAIGLAGSLARSVHAVLVDLDQNWPSIAQRLDLSVHPNIRSALDHALHDPRRLRTSLQSVGSLSVVGGRADGGNGPAITRHETVALLEGLGELVDVVVADMGPVSRTAGGLLREFDTMIIVGVATPVGIARLVKTADQLLGSWPDQSLLAVVNMTPRSGFRRTEALAELARTVPDLPVVSLPHDARLEDAAWNGNLGCGARYRRAMDSMSEVVVESLP